MCTAIRCSKLDTWLITLVSLTLIVINFSIGIVCPHLDAPRYGKVRVNTYTPTSKAYYSCDEGYRLYGLEWRKCLYSGQWYGHAPTCRPVKSKWLTPVSCFSDKLIVVISLQRSFALILMLQDMARLGWMGILLHPKLTTVVTKGTGSMVSSGGSVCTTAIGMDMLQPVTLSSINYIDLYPRLSLTQSTFNLFRTNL